MKNYKISLLTLVFTFVFLAGIIFQQNVAAEADLACADLSKCKGAAKCEGPGEVKNDCTIECQAGASITCDKKEEPD